jgi:hypothetical protein
MLLGSWERERLTGENLKVVWAKVLPGNTKCTVDLLFDWFGLVCFAKMSVVIQLIPNQSNRRSTVQ